MNIAINTIVTPINTKIGVGVYIDNLIENLLREYPEHQFFGIVSSSQSSFHYDFENYNTIAFSAKPQPSALLALWQPAFSRSLRSIQSDIYHLPNTSPLFVHGCPTVASIHDLQEFKIRKYSLLRTVYRRLANYQMSRRADLILTLSNSSKQDIVQILGVDPSKVRVVYLACSDNYRRLDKQDAKRYIWDKFSVKDYLITVGDIQPGKNLVRLIEAYARLRGKGERRQLVLIGKERKRYSQLHNMIRKLNLDDHVKFTGYVSQEDLVYFYNAAHLCIFPSLYEGFGLPILEAMACGVPVAASNISSIPEVAGEAAALFDPYQVEDMVAKIEQIINAPSTLDRMVELGKHQVGGFSWQRTAIETMEAYEYVAEQKRSSKNSNSRSPG